MPSPEKNLLFDQNLFSLLSDLSQNFQQLKRCHRRQQNPLKFQRPIFHRILFEWERKFSRFQTKCQIEWKPFVAGAKRIMWSNKYSPYLRICKLLSSDKRYVSSKPWSRMKKKRCNKFRRKQSRFFGSRQKSENFNWIPINGFQNVNSYFSYDHHSFASPENRTRSFGSIDYSTKCSTHKPFNCLK